MDLVILMYYSQARRQGGFEGVRSNPPPPFWPPKEYIALLYILSALPLESGPLLALVVSLLLRITAVQASLVVAMWDCS